MNPFFLSRSTSTSTFLELRRLVIDLYENKKKVNQINLIFLLLLLNF